MALKNDWKIFSNFRLLGGGAIGNSKNARPSGGTYSRDILVTASLTAGFFKEI